MKMRLLLSLLAVSFLPVAAKQECKPTNPYKVTKKARRGSGRKKQKQETLSPGIHELNDERRLQRIVQGNDEVLVLFHSSACGACERIMRVIKQYSKANPKLVIVRAHRGQSKRLVKKYAVRGVPTLMFFKKGKVVKRLVGFKTFKKLTRELAEV